MGRLTEVDLEFELFDNSFSGTIPTQLGLLTDLNARFRLDNNRLSGWVPSQLGRISKLNNHFDVSHNSLLGSLPTELLLLKSSGTCRLTYNRDASNSPSPPTNAFDCPLPILNSNCHGSGDSALDCFTAPSPPSPPSAPPPPATPRVEQVVVPAPSSLSIVGNVSCSTHISNPIFVAVVGPYA